MNVTLVSSASVMVFRDLCHSNKGKPIVYLENARVIRQKHKAYFLSFELSTSNESSAFGVLHDNLLSLFFYVQMHIHELLAIRQK